MATTEDNKFVCCICGKTVVGEYGNNPFPVVEEPGAKCCDECDYMVVIPARIKKLTE